jgi:GNAT superfamily N-acetyltransferase
MVKLQTLQIKVMTREDVQRACDWAAREGWNPGLSDAIAFYETDPEGFWMGWLGDEPVVCMSAVEYDDTYCFLGFYIVAPEHRGKGLGWAMWTHLVNTRFRARTLGGDGVVAQQANYAKEGMVLAYRNIRFELSQPQGFLVDSSLTPIGQVPFTDVLAYDTRHFPTKRETFLNQWLTLPGHTGFGIVEAGLLKGYGVIRPCHRGFKIGPLFADTPDIADRLFCGLVAQANGEPVFLDTPECNPDAVALAKRYGMVQQFETARIYIGPAPEQPMEEIYGITSFELG